MITKNELDVANNIIFEILAKHCISVDKLSFNQIFQWSLYQIIAFLRSQKVMQKINIENLQHATHFP